MKREWKPGDVARVKCADLTSRVAVLHMDGSWMTKDGKWGVAVAYDPRPLVVLDPEDREDVKRLLGALSIPELGGTLVVDHVQRALRSLVAPPKPDEPTGLGAVVEDDEGSPWVRGPGDDGRRVWIPNGPMDPKRYADIAAVRVLSEGVQP